MNETSKGDAGMDATVEHDHCLRPGCGRKLTAAKSRRDGFGPVCKRRIRAAATLVVAKAEQITKAAALIEACRIIPAEPGVYAATSSNGADTYYVADAETCTCPAGERARYCYHLAAAQILTAATLRRRSLTGA
ncbi:MAG: hypothetical protein KGJ86_09185 [Chloroflexota bacterium]|nr:hypothetical protein [Chloroflexota bacterium]